MDRARVQELFDWLVDGAPGATKAVAVLERLAEGGRAAGIPLDRVAAFVTTLHPHILGRSFVWTPNAPVKIGGLTAQFLQTEDYRRSPVAVATDEHVELRRRLAEGVAEDDFSSLRNLAANGYTDYLCVPLPFTSGETQAVAFSTRHPAGFADEELDALRDLARPLARVAEIFAMRRTATNLLSTYVGRNAGDRVLAGRIFRGDVEAIQAMIWFSDLRGFTSLSARLPPRAIVEVLNSLFDAQVPSIERRGGEVLKFIGDGLLAIFPVRVGADAVLEAAEEAFASVDARNASAPQPIDFGLALHVGEVAYGNIGGRSRLDFTAIGPAVNLAARLEGLTSRLQRRVVVSQAFADRATHPLELLGTFELKGVPRSEPVYGLKDRTR